MDITFCINWEILTICLTIQYWNEGFTLFSKRYPEIYDRKYFGKLLFIGINLRECEQLKVVLYINEIEMRRSIMDGRFENIIQRQSVIDEKLQWTRKGSTHWQWLILKIHHRHEWLMNFWLREIHRNRWSHSSAIKYESDPKIQKLLFFLRKLFFCSGLFVSEINKNLFRQMVLIIVNFRSTFPEHFQSEKMF